MKQIALILLTLLTITSCNSQTIKVTYSEKMDLTEELKSINDPMIKQMIIEKTGKPKYFELISNNGISIYKKSKQENQDINNGVTVIGGNVVKTYFIKIIRIKYI